MMAASLGWRGCQGLWGAKLAWRSLGGIIPGVEGLGGGFGAAGGAAQIVLFVSFVAHDKHLVHTGLCALYHPHGWR